MTRHPDLPRYANLRDGDLVCDEGRLTLTGLRVVMFAAAAGAGAVLGILTAPDVAVMQTGPGFGICNTKGC